MRCMMTIHMDTEAGNKAITDGTLPKLMQQLMERLQPEASYFTADGGTRAAFLFFDLADPSDLPVITEPAFMGLNAKIGFSPVMNLDDLQKGLARLS